MFHLICKDIALHIEWEISQHSWKIQRSHTYKKKGDNFYLSYGLMRSLKEQVNVACDIWGYHTVHWVRDQSFWKGKQVWNCKVPLYGKKKDNFTLVYMVSWDVKRTGKSCDLWLYQTSH